MVNPAVRYLPPSLCMIDFASRFGGKLDMVCSVMRFSRRFLWSAAALLPLFLLSFPAGGQTTGAKSSKPGNKPKLVVLLVVDQMRADYVDKFRFQWTGGLKRLVEEGEIGRASCRERV